MLVRMRLLWRSRAATSWWWSNGAAGTGKSYVLAAAREALEADGLRVIGAALQGKTADDMQRDAGITSRTLHSLFSGVERGTITLDAKTVLVIDEAGMVGSRQMEKLLGHAQAAGARVRLVGDAWQLHAVDAGDAFRAVSREAAAANRLESLTRDQAAERGLAARRDFRRWPGTMCKRPCPRTRSAVACSCIRPSPTRESS